MNLPSAEHLHEIFYCSLLAPGESPRTVAGILAQSRQANADKGITGLLIFDGLHFLQQVEGPRDQVQGLMGRITADPRHVGIRVIFEGPLPARRSNVFEMGYSEPDEDDVLYERMVNEGEAGLLRFLAQRPSYDIRR
ncbi:BLUF domain-containing protein [Variovorax sp. OV329]|uniref:BLUF domain-containing protein n=1 Tax=Variovorax sp. OV329 TaxID=1882825 RepID=UPI0008E5DF78|nr:BLUF domain-containing protein [Variovorax sp. OV329]SFM78290.1 Sensors of blue-light using FAD [Variovorax sp. OV329]